MKKIVLNALLFFSFIFLTNYALAYEIETHSAITKHAFIDSVLGAGYLDNIGLSVTDEFYGNKKVVEWLQDGAKLEDETIPSDAGGEWFRYQHHFFDPIINRGLEYDLKVTSLDIIYHISGYMAPDWALEDTTSYPTQIFSIKHAKEYYLAGLTASDKTIRAQNLAKTFTALGQVMHTVQDMAQPQHTRNDAHGGDIFGTSNWTQIFGVKSQYELYVDGRIRALNYSPDYIPGNPIFNSYRNFYTTSDGKGLADFSNRSFVTEGTNFHCWQVNMSNGCDVASVPDGYTLPAFNKNLKSEIPVNTLPDVNSELTGLVTFYGNQITDAYSNQTFINNTMTTYSIFDKDLENKGMPPAFTLNKFNYDSMAGNLIPRAVGYSAGLLNYFFRGEIDLKVDTGIPDSYFIMNCSNEPITTDDTGSFSLYYDDENENRVLVDTIDWTPIKNITIVAKNGSDCTPSASPIVFSEPANYNPKEKGKYILVFNGKLGNEEGAVIGKEVYLSSVFEDWEYGLTGRHPWVKNDPLGRTDVIDTNASHVLKMISNYFSEIAVSFDKPLLPKKVSFDYYAKSFGSLPYHNSLKFWVRDLDSVDNSGISWICAVSIGNPELCGTFGCLNVERNKWVHVEIDIPKVCNQAVKKIDRLGFWVWHDLVGIDDVKENEIHIDNINFE